MTEKTKKSNVHWNHVRQPWQSHIVNMYQLIDKHSEMFVKTGDRFHEQSYQILTDYLHSLKTHIKAQEDGLTNNFKSSIISTTNNQRGKND